MAVDLASSTRHVDEGFLDVSEVRSFAMPYSRPFFEYWGARATFIEKLEPHENFYEANVLAWTTLDALANLWARCLRPELKRGRDRRRMGEFLACHGGDAFERVSLPALWALSEKLDSPAPEVLARLRHDRRNPTIIERRPRSVSDDPLASQLLVELSDIKTNVVRPKARPEDRSVEALVLDARLGEIAYTEMRCAIVHEGRLGAGGHGFDLGSESADAPTYLSDVFGVPPSIGFSPRYMVKIIHACIRGFDAEASAAHVDPVPKPHGPIDLDDDG